MREGLLEKLFWFSGWLYDFSKYATILLAVGLIVHYFFYSVVIVRGESMEPNYMDGDIMVVDKISYRVDQPKRGDVVAMFFPGEPRNRFLKRVIGLPGENVTIQDGAILLNGEPLDEQYLPEGVLTFPNIERDLIEGEYFVVGDNRGASSDSRAWGPVPNNYIIGKAQRKLVNIGSRTRANEPLVPSSW